MEAFSRYTNFYFIFCFPLPWTYVAAALVLEGCNPILGIILYPKAAILYCIEINTTEQFTLFIFSHFSLILKATHNTIFFYLFKSTKQYLSHLLLKKYSVQMEKIT